MKREFFTKLPVSLRIGAYDVPIVVQPLPWSDSQKAFGLFETNPMTISLAEDVACPITSVVTLRHEINHAICSVYCLVDGETEERVVDVMAHGWTQIERDNPDLTAWFAFAMAESK